MSHLEPCFSSDTPTLTVPNLKLKSVGDRSFCSIEPRLWNSLVHSRRAGALACSDEIPETVNALQRLQSSTASTTSLFLGRSFWWPLVCSVSAFVSFYLAAGCAKACRYASGLGQATQQSTLSRATPATCKINVREKWLISVTVTAQIKRGSAMQILKITFDLLHHSKLLFNLP